MGQIVKRVSIAMTACNGEKYIEEQIRSILLSSYPLYEIVICDDCSTDETSRIIRDMARENNLIKVFVNHTRLGYKENFRNAINRCSGDIIFLADQDDVWLEDKVRNMVEIMDSDDRILVLNSAIFLIDAEGNRISKVGSQGSNAGIIKNKLKEGAICEFNTKYLLKQNISPGCTICFRSEVKELIKGVECFIRPHDWYINLIATLYNGLFFVNEQYTGYRLHGNNQIGFSFMEHKKTRRSKENEILYLNELSTIMTGSSLLQKMLPDFKKCIDNRSCFYRKTNMRNFFALLFTKGYLKYFGIKKSFKDFLVLFGVIR